VSIRFAQVILVGGKQFSSLELREKYYSFSQDAVGVSFKVGEQRILVPWSAVLCVVSE
jgi:hypothetical protein